MRRRLTLTMLVLASLAAPATASADTFDKVYVEFRKSGSVDGCAHSAKALERAREQAPADIAKRAAGFPAALDAAIAQRSAGGCDTAADAGATTPATSTVPTTDTPAPAQDPAAEQQAADAAAAGNAGQTTQPAPGTAATPATADGAAPVPARTTDGGGVSGAVLLLAAVGALLLLAAVAWGAARWWAWEPPWLVRARHATGEAGWRTSAAWAEFRDWVRLGR
jgi:hypothetical protein